MYRYAILTLWIVGSSDLITYFTPYNPGVPISEPVAGVAVGLVTKMAEDGEVADYRILTDLLVRFMDVVIG